MKHLLIRAGAAVGIAAAVALSMQSPSTGAANGARETLPPEKQAILDAEASFRTAGQPRDKSKDSGRPLIVQEDPPPLTGMLGAVQAPTFGGVFTTTNAWAGWVNPTTYVTVYAGAPSGSPADGELFVVTRTGRDGRLDGAGPSGQLVSVPGSGGPLRIVRIDAGDVIVANPGGQEFRFNPLSRLLE